MIVTCDICGTDVEDVLGPAQPKHGVFVTIAVERRSVLLGATVEHRVLDYVGGVCDRCVRIAYITAASFDAARGQLSGVGADLPRTVALAPRARRRGPIGRLLAWLGVA